MDTLLTTRQLQDMLKVDRITIYRMLADGRLHGVKVGQQWRFRTSDVEKFIETCSEDSAPVEMTTAAALPVHCIQAIQNVFANIGQVAAMVIDSQGKLMTEISRPCLFCTLLTANPSSREACQGSWQEFARNPVNESGFLTCHAGLHYACAPIQSGGQTIAYLLAGQFFAVPRETIPHNHLMRQLVRAYHLPIEALSTTFFQIPILNEPKRSQVMRWPADVVTSIHSILNERATLLDRLQRIAEISQVSS